jgi:hypothetical protein
MWDVAVAAGKGFNGLALHDLRGFFCKKKFHPYRNT